MATTQAAPRLRPIATERPEPPKDRPVVWWAVAGALCLAMAIYVWTSWFISGNAKTTPTGVDPVPEWMKVSVHLQEVLGLMALAFFAYWFLIRPCLRERRLTLTTDGIFAISFFLMWWQDPLLIFTQQWSFYNSEMLNIGSWSENIPGWVSPDGSLFAEPIIWAGPAYVWAIFGGVIIANRLMRKAKARWPGLSNGGLIMLTLVGFMVFDIIIEAVWLRTGVYAYPGAVKELTLFHGHYYQFPMYESVFFGGTWAVWACLRYFRDDKGQTIAERGIERVRVSKRWRTPLRFFAILGVMNVIFLVGTNIPLQLFAMHASPFPEDFANRSYLRDQLCGEGTKRACASPDLPIPRSDSAYFDSNGDVVLPSGETVTVPATDLPSGSP